MGIADACRSQELCDMMVKDVKHMEDIFYSIVPYTVVVATLLVLGVTLFRIPPPESRAVLEILGRDPELDREDSSHVTYAIAHRGAGWDAPENSLPAFKLCSAKGCDFVEFDVSLTSDGIPIVFHDRTLDRMTGLDIVINDTSWEKLSKIDISVKHRLQNKFADTRIPTLDQAISQILSCGQRMIIDIKDNDFKMVAVIIELFKKYPELRFRSIVSSFFPHLIYLIRWNNPKIVCSLAWKPGEFVYEICENGGYRVRRISDVWYNHYFRQLCDTLHSWALPRITYYLLGISIILLHKDSLSGEAIINWRRKGIRVMTWTINEPTEKQFVEENLRITYLTDTLDQSTCVSVG